MGFGRMFLLSNLENMTFRKQTKNIDCVWKVWHLVQGVIPGHSLQSQPRNSWRKDRRVLNEEVNKNNSKKGANTKIILKYALSFWILDVLKYIVAFIEIKNFPPLQFDKPYCHDKSTHYLQLVKCRTRCNRLWIISCSFLATFIFSHFFISEQLDIEKSQT